MTSKQTKKESNNADTPTPEGILQHKIQITYDTSEYKHFQPCALTRKIITCLFKTNLPYTFQIIPTSGNTISQSNEFPQNIKPFRKQFQQDPPNDMYAVHTTYTVYMVIHATIPWQTLYNAETQQYAEDHDAWIELCDPTKEPMQEVGWFQTAQYSFYVVRSDK